MKEYNIEGKKMTDKARAYTHLTHRLELDEGAIQGTDDLWDALMAIDRTTVINFYDKDAMLDQLGQRGETILKAFTDAANGNDDIILEID
ncbi:MAG: barstar family protein [Eubacteriaceae bacterium]|nr:barstar family protein [Eubacteriaceae bacterium]